MDASISYHFPRLGKVTTTLHDYTRDLYDLLETDRLVSRMQRTDQLGNLRHFYPGAHHTRYEYIVLQWHLLDRLARSHVEAQELMGLNGPVQEVPHVHGAKGPPTGVDVLQSVVLLSNVGHLPDTMAAERAVMALMEERPELLQAFKKGLDGGSALHLEKAQRQFDIDSFRYLSIALWLQRALNRDVDRQAVRYAQAILQRVLLENRTDWHWTRLITLYRHVRRLSYLALDTLYTPAPFSLELGTLMADLMDNPETYMLEESTFQRALRQLDEVMREVVYQSPNALISMAITTDKRRQALERVAAQLSKDGEWVNCLFPQKTGSPLGRVLHEPLNPDDFGSWEMARTVAFRVSLSEAPGSGWANTVKLEEGLRQQAGGGAWVGCDWDRGSGSLGVAFSMPKSEPSEWAETSERFVLAILTRLLRSPSRAMLEPAQARTVYLYLWRAFLNSRYRPAVLNDAVAAMPEPIFWGLHGGMVQDQLENWAARAEESGVAASTVHEVRVLSTVVAPLKDGPLLAYGGKTVLMGSKHGQPVAEWDGVVFGGHSSDEAGQMLIVEAKLPGTAPAMTQLRQRVAEIFPQARPEYTSVAGGAVATIRV